MQTRIPFTCPECRASLINDVAVPVVPGRTPAAVPGNGLRCPPCYRRMKVWENAEKGVRAAYEARLPRRKE